MIELHLAVGTALRAKRQERNQPKGSSITSHYQPRKWLGLNDWKGKEIGTEGTSLTRLSVASWLFPQPLHPPSHPFPSSLDWFHVSYAVPLRYPLGRTWEPVNRGWNQSIMSESSFSPSHLRSCPGVLSLVPRLSATCGANEMGTR